jgi:hypothetical protein
MRARFEFDKLGLEVIEFWLTSLTFLEQFYSVAIGYRLSCFSSSARAFSRSLSTY